MILYLNDTEEDDRKHLDLKNIFIKRAENKSIHKNHCFLYANIYKKSKKKNGWKHTNVIKLFSSK